MVFCPAKLAEYKRRQRELSNKAACFVKKDSPRPGVNGNNNAIISEETQLVQNYENGGDMKTGQGNDNQNEKRKNSLKGKNGEKGDSGEKRNSIDKGNNGDKGNGGDKGNSNEKGKSGKSGKNGKRKKRDNDDSRLCYCEEEDESSSSDSELDIEFTPPAGIIHPERFKKKQNVIHCDTQYDPKDFEVRKKKSKEGKGKGKGKGKDKGKPGKKGKK
ncbi:hypothetical protein NQ314_012867 [Rhamnusium bicolor]|uniref:DUF4776 domain-containing protein n=1 Tax=Rhamnusium bicolor TaxID=1586634 RepID=A0AAV8XA10_9CUCU|nr:hypothetical protein NQ314_012867 [Rhamnusium bicolor]